MVLSPNGEYLAFQPKEKNDIIIEKLHHNQQQVVKNISGLYAHSMQFSPDNLHFFATDNSGTTIWQNNITHYAPFQIINGQSQHVVSVQSDDLCLIGQPYDQELKMIVWRFYAKELEPN
jgi:hypothetical protein